MIAAMVAAALTGLLILSTVTMRRREHRRDSVRRFSDARQAMSAIHRMSAVRRSNVTAQSSDGVQEPSSVVVRDGSATLFDPIARRHVDEVRKSFRRDSEVLARRPTVAMLPTLLTSRSAADAGANGVSAPVAGDNDVDAPAAPLPFRTSEAS
jgi:hypothetical protein